MIVYSDYVAGKDVGTDSYPRTSLAEGAVIGCEGKKITVGVDEAAIAAATGANDSKEEGAEKLDESKETVINIVNAHELQKIEFKDAKEYKTMQNGYWKELKSSLDRDRFSLLFDNKDYKVPADKKVAAEAEKEAEAKLGKADKVALAVIDKRLANFKKNFPALSKFINEEVVANFGEFDFYMANESELGKCMIIPARYVGEATAPTFYYFVDGIEEKKF